MEMHTRVHARNLVAWAKDRPEVLVLSGDLTTSCEVDTFRDAYPDRFYSMGLAEQNMLSVAGGLAREGYTPFVHTFAVFMYRRALDQLEMSIAYPNLRVRLFGFLPGVTTPGGATHQAIDDLGVLRALPNMTILETGDATDVESVLDLSATIDGPVYIRMVRGEIPRLFHPADRMQLNHARMLSTGTDVTLLSTGICTEEAMRATQALAARGVSIQHLHITTLKPFSDPQVIESLSRAKRGIITLENHSIMGGLGTAVAELMAEHGIGTRLTRLGIPDTYIHGASRAYLMREYGLDAPALVRAVERIVDQPLNITTDDLAAARFSTFAAENQQEAL
ncbi:MAG TPA: transketolase C-terminal domain-containing protein [Aggregatilineales bacterium]|nr:transketolase C-terminal domain-containing protein [Aggregatilineales bacterium]